ncbi:MAG: AAA family ATPase [Chloroflexota bacterium]|nr:AAA family ATPase [Chloroflexota bacterium]
MIRLRRLRLSQYKGLAQVDLAFPSQGSVLIEGLNEAGKSTLFDGLHFALYGRPLVGDLAEVFTYGAERTMASAELDIDTGSGSDTGVDRTRLIVERRLTSRTGSPGHQVQLSVQEAESGDVESVRGVRAVRERLIAELGGLTSEALQNSCLVVQKALGRLETLSRAERERALSVLLNLGRLSEIENALRPTRVYEDEVRRAEGIAGMAAVAAERITLQALFMAPGRLAAGAGLRDYLAAVYRAGGAADGAAADRKAADRDLAAATARLKAIAHAEAQRQSWRDLRGTVQRLSEAERQLKAAAATLAATEQEAAQLAAAKARAAAAHDLSTKVEAVRVAEETCVRRADEHQEAQRRVAECAVWRVDQRKVSRQLVELEQTIAVAEARRQLHDVEHVYARLDDERREAEQRVAQCAAWRSEQSNVTQQLAALERTIAIAETRRQLRGVEQEYARLDSEHQEAQQRVAQCAAWRAAQQEVAAQLAQVEQAIARAEVQRQNRAERERLTRLRNHLQDWAQIAGRHAAIRTARRRLNVAGGGAGVLTVALALLLVTSAPVALIAVCVLGWLGALLTSAAFAASAGVLPGTSQFDANELDARLQSTTAALHDQGETTPLTATGVQQRIGSVETALAALADDGYGEVAEAGYRDLLGQRGQLQRQQEELAASLAQEPALQAAATQAAAALAACAAKLTAQKRALVAQLGDSDDGRGAVDDAGYRGLLEERGQLQQQQEELTTNLAQEPALQATATQAAAAVAACAAKLTAQKQALVAQLDSSSDDGRGAVDEAGYRGLLEQRGQLQRQAEELATNLAQEPALQAAAVQAGEALAACRADLEDQWQTLTARLGRDYAPDHQAAARAIRAQEQRAAQKVATAAAAAERHPREQAQMERWQSTCTELRAEVEQQLTALDAAMPAETDAIADLARQELHKIAAEIARLNPEQAAVAQQDALERRGAAVTRQEQALAEGHRLAASAVEAASGLGTTLADVAAVWQRAAQIRQALPAVTEPLPPTEDIEAQVSELDRRLVRCDQDIRRIHEDLALPADYVVPGVAEANEAAREARLELQSRRYVVQVLTQARRKMIAKVLPSTEQNMCLLLPELTAGRYRHARLDQDYRFQVWDERKRGDIEKKLLSGGTQDQFSLALRLGFAIAALPQEVGTRPGFLFLDEPLSSFDRDRTQALVNLLTRGTITSHFPQVFLISHSTLFDPHMFTYHVVMEAGGVASSTLPPPEPEALLPGRA